MTTQPVTSTTLPFTDRPAEVARIRERWATEPTGRYPAATEERDYGDVRILLAIVDDLTSRLGCVVEATYWDRPYDERIVAIRGMCDLSTDGLTPSEELYP